MTTYGLTKLLILFLGGFEITQAVPWQGASQTAEASTFSSLLQWSPEPTARPDSEPNLELLKRDQQIPASVCGWVSEGSYSKYLGHRICPFLATVETNCHI
jgi:hypothetical protein